MLLAWLDLETTGLNPKADRILAVGCIVTDERLRERARGEWFLSCPPDVEFCDVKVFEMHTRSGLLDRCTASKVGLSDCLVELHQLLALSCGAERPHLAGNTVHFDRRFLEPHLNMDKRFHHRHLDVSTLLVLAMMAGAVKDEASLEPKAHTPIADLERSMRLLRRHQAEMFLPEFRVAPELGVPHG